MTVVIPTWIVETTMNNGRPVRSKLIGKFAFSQGHPNYYGARVEFHAILINIEGGLFVFQPLNQLNGQPVGPLVSLTSRHLAGVQWWNGWKQYRVQELTDAITIAKKPGNYLQPEILKAYQGELARLAAEIETEEVANVR